MIQESPVLPPALKKELINNLPGIMEEFDEAALKVFDPSKVWFEALQFADYTGQAGEHLASECGENCREDIAEQLQVMASSFKHLAERSLQVLDAAEGVIQYKKET